MFLSSNYFWGEQIPLSDEILYFFYFFIGQVLYGWKFLNNTFRRRRAPERQKVWADISYISDSCRLIRQLFLPSRHRKLRLFSERRRTKIEQLETLCFGGKVDSEIWCYLELQVAPTVCQILNLSWLPSRPKLFTKQIRFASSTTSMPLSLKYYHHFGHKDMLISLNQYQVSLHLM